MIHDTQSAQISQKQGEHNIMKGEHNIYVIMKTCYEHSVCRESLITTYIMLFV